MLKYSLAAGLLACAALTPVAFAQDKPASSGGGNIKFVQTIEAQQFRGSELMGQTVYNNQDEAIGDIGDVILDRQGRAQAVVIDVGGFLGIGEREVGVPFNALRFERNEDRVASSTSGSGSGNTSQSGDPSRSAAADAQSSQGGSMPSGASGGRASTDAPAASSNTGTGSAAQSAAQGQAGSQSTAQGQSGAGTSGQMGLATQSSQRDSSSQSSLENVRIVLNTSRDDLQNAPELKNPGEQSESGAAGGSGYGASGSGASGSGAGAPAK